VPPSLLGRVSATQSVVKTAIVPFGAIAGQPPRPAEAVVLI